MSGPELSSLQGLEDKHLRVLGRHGITDLRGLVDADREIIHRAMANLRPRPPRDQIARWQDEAGGLLAAAAADDSDAADDPSYPAWRTAASFVVVFLERRVDRERERRVEAERTEVEPERNAEAWPGWDIGPVFDWMLGQLRPIADDGPDDSDGPSTGGDSGEPVQPAQPAQPAEQRAGAAEPALRRPALRIDGAVLIDAAGREVTPAAGPPVWELVAPARVAFTVSGARPKTRLLAVARVLRPDGPGWNAQEPAEVPGSGRVELDLSAIPEGEHDVSLIAWAPDATAMPVSVQLPRLAIRVG